MRIIITMTTADIIITIITATITVMIMAMGTTAVITTTMPAQPTIARPATPAFSTAAPIRPASGLPA